MYILQLLKKHENTIFIKPMTPIVTKLPCSNKKKSARNYYFAQIMNVNGK